MTNIEKTIAAVHALKGHKESLNAISIKIGVAPATLWRAVNHKGHVGTFIIQKLTEGGYLKNYVTRPEKKLDSKQLVKLRKIKFLMKQYVFGENDAQRANDLMDELMGEQ